MKKFELGKVVMTKGIAELIYTEIGYDLDFDTGLCDALIKHSNCDLGNLDEEDKMLNDMAVVDGGRILSAYEIGEDKVKIWIITEADRSYTTILLPEEY